MVLSCRMYVTDKQTDKPILRRYFVIANWQYHSALGFRVFLANNFFYSLWHWMSNLPEPCSDGPVSIFLSDFGNTRGRWLEGGVLQPPASCSRWLWIKIRAFLGIQVRNGGSRSSPFIAPFLPTPTHWVSGQRPIQHHYVASLRLKKTHATHSKNKQTNDPPPSLHPSSHNKTNTGQRPIQ